MNSAVCVPSVSAAGENGSEAADRVCGVRRVQQSSAHQRRQHGGWKERCVVLYYVILCHINHLHQ